MKGTPQGVVGSNKKLQATWCGTIKTMELSAGDRRLLNTVLGLKPRPKTTRSDPEYLERQREYGRQRSAARAKLRERALEDRSCEVCGESRPWVLDFHHIDPAEKSFSLSRSPLDPELFLSEVGKCRVLCANCHRDLHRSS